LKSECHSNSLFGVLDYMLLLIILQTYITGNIKF